MPSAPHEVVIDMFNARPDLVAPLLSALGCQLPCYETVEPRSERAAVLAPTEYYADAVLAFRRGGDTVLAVVVEIQLRRDGDKLWSWPVYTASLRARLRCPVLLLVICPDPRTATWAAQPLHFGYGNPPTTLAPLVLDPSSVPVVTDPDLAAELPELAVLSAVAHPDHPDHTEIWRALAIGLRTLGADPALRYHDFILTMLPRAVRPAWEAFMSTGLRDYNFTSDFARKYFAEGEAQGEAIGEAKSVLTVLDARGITVSDQVRETILSCRDLDQLQKWLRRALEVGRAEELLA
ncbi:hypothetical protein IU443_19765 [Nocardia farcinica]|uniref:Uncharacterized protein n=1 Tax=Nocardia farcinica TaxID=37329 RepID=A0A0H5P301_NOCFR|nr:hypothetical protein [Nocardia farcinica]AXK87413.1 hypothetical protein DXT66_18875 [Nocardia farcinica]MBF6253008.1 hypothetical protein [Nocardia farcinica]MBF6264691.1 hypothetical protein [Nocardia farcinica]MBF6283476.1 hypothetical protein [Nocardia farcinica]MBF6307258.1 hypothetical protein [Nocardia farcinica]